MSQSKLEPIDSKLDLVKVEKLVLDYWNNNNIFEKVKAQNKENDEWVYYDGPITANGMPHYGHAITWTMKDVVPRYWTMQGFSVDRNIGWDCQGILVEYEVEKKLDFDQKSDIEEFGIAKFNDLCRDSVLDYRKVMVDYEKRLGRWIDKDSEYATMDPEYIESTWWSLKKLHEKDLLYEGHKVVAYSTRAGMTLSEHEVADGGYEEVVDPAVTIKFKKKDKDNTYFLAWTTTPWTLPGNLMLSIGKDIDYVKVKQNNEYYILAREALERVFGENGDYEVVKNIKASELEGAEYEPIFEYFKEKRKEGAFKVIYADHVSTEEGTGIVHLAPYGKEDFDILSMEIGIELFDYLDDEAHFTTLISDYEGMFYKQANKKIIGDLKEKELLLKHEKYAHQMPMCYRTGTPLIYKPIKSWYVNIDKIKDKLKEESNKVNFVPNFGKERFENWINKAWDWSLSRKRYWGTPLPLWKNDKTGEVKFIGSFNELEELSGKNLPENFDPHKPYVDDITWKGKNGGVFKRVSEVIDVWYDSGSMPFAQFHYPFENKELFKQRFPAEFISEGDDQIRLWFYTMFVLGVALFDKSPFKNVIVIGMLGDEDGKKLSKSKGNYPPVEEVFEKYGSDMFRYFLLNSPVVRGEASRFSYKLLEETKKEFFTIFWNSYRYFITYANSYNFKPESFSKENILDKWILTRLNETVYKVNKHMEDYEVLYAARELAPFINDLSTWYIRRSRNRISSGDKDALNVLFKCLITFSKLMAPFMPLLAESMYLNLSKVLESSKESVHLEGYPEAEKLDKKEEDLLEKMEYIRSLASLGNAARKKADIPLRQALEEFVIKNEELRIENMLLKVLKEELNVKEIDFVKEIPKGKNWEKVKEKGLVVALNTKITPELELEGEYRKLIRDIQNMRKKEGLQVGDEISLTLEETPKNKKIVERFKDEFKERVGANKVKFGTDTTISLL